MSKKLLDRIAAGFAVFLIVVALLVSFGVTVSDGHLRQDVSVLAKVSPSVFSSSSELPAGSQVDLVRLRTHVIDPSVAANGWLALWRIPSVVLATSIATIIWVLARSVADGAAFSLVNIKRLRCIAALLIIAPLVKLLGEYARKRFLDYSALAHVPLAHISIQTAAPALGGLGALLIAEAVSAGRRAVQDTEGLI